ncbi:NADase-type glycan-binding domain-containing protein [Streptomyces sp. NPDC088157]|uniref:NADase-type glycan-binding domain-containing protein n=1 Tax=Streptomyces sp. NPDC088157 TaxID=3365832 RepID=UPI003820DD8D
MTTQNCAECGTRAEPGQSFCDACGAVLSWTDRPPARTGAGTGAGTGSGSDPGPASNPAAGSGPDLGAGSGPGSNPGGSGPGSHPAGSGSDSAAGPASGSGSGAGPSSGYGADSGSRTGSAYGAGSAYGSATGADSSPRTGSAYGADSAYGSASGGDSGAVGGGSPTGYRSEDGSREPSGLSGPPAGAVSVTASAAAAAPPAPVSGTAVANAAAPSSPRTAPEPTTRAAAPADDDHDPDDEDTTETPLPVIPPEDGTAAPSGVAPTPAHAPDETAPTTPVPAAAAPAPALGDTMAARARSLLVPVADAEPRPAAPPSVAPVLPGRPVADRPQVRAPGPVQGEQYGVACPWCATPNNPDRHFCVRCAMPMTLEDRSSIRLPWWRRLFNRNGETHWAGDRPRLRRTFDRILGWLVAAVVLTLLIIAGVNTPAAIQATRDHFAKRAPVAPDSFAASRSYPGHKPDLAFDKINNSWWGPGVSESGEGEWIEARFDEPTRLLDLIITSGTSVRPDQLTQSALPHRIKATITLKDGKTITRQITLDQSAGPQPRAFRVGEVTKVRFTIESSYMASASKQVALAEIEFIGPSSANAT